MQLSLRGKKITINQILWSKLCYIGQLYTIPKCIWKKTEKVETISFWPTKYKTSQAPTSAPHIWKGGLGISDRYSIEFFKNEMDSKLIESFQFATKTKALGK